MLALNSLFSFRHREEYSGPLEYDLGSLTASSHNPVDQERFKADPNSACLDLATQITQSLVARLFELPSEAAPVEHFQILGNRGLCPVRAVAYSIVIDCMPWCGWP